MIAASKKSAFSIFSCLPLTAATHATLLLLFVFLT